MSIQLSEYRQRAIEVGEKEQRINNKGYLLYKDRLAISREGDLYVRLLDKVYRQISIAYQGVEKIKVLISIQYYQLGQESNIIRYINNYLVYKRTQVQQDRVLGLLQSLLVLIRSQQYISIDFYELLKDRRGFNEVYIIVDRLSKRVISILYYKTTSARDIALLFLQYIYQYYRLPKIIISNRRGYFISQFQKEVYLILRIKLKLSISYYLQTDSQIEIIN